MRAFMAAALLATGVVVPAWAGDSAQTCTTAPASQWLPLDRLEANVAAQGYVIDRARIRNGCGEIAAFPTATGAFEHLVVDPATGRVVGVR
jgi:hypothetical protein